MRSDELEQISQCSSQEFIGMDSIVVGEVR